MIKGLSPRKASLDDLDQVAAIEAYSNSPPWSKEAFRADINKKNIHFLVLTDDETDEQVYAYIVFSQVAEQAYIQTFGVRRESRRQGVAAHFLRQVIHYVHRLKGESIVLELRKSNQAALTLYQALGFIIIRTVKNQYPDGEDAYSMIYRTNVLAADGEEDEDKDLTEAEEEFHGSKKNLN